MLETNLKWGAAADDLLLAQREPGTRELASHQREVPRVGVSRSIDVDGLERDHAAAEHHRLQIGPAAAGQHAGDVLKQAAIDPFLTPGPIFGRGAKVLERAEAGDCIERAEGVGGDLSRVPKVDVETVTAASRDLRGPWPR